MAQNQINQIVLEAELGYYKNMFGQRQMSTPADADYVTVLSNTDESDIAPVPSPNQSFYTPANQNINTSALQTYLMSFDRKEDVL